MTDQSKAAFTKWFGPLLDALRDLGDSGKPREVSDKIANNLNLPDSFLDKTIKSGQGKFYNQVAWARQYLVWEGLLDSSKHGTWKLTEKGKSKTLDDSESQEIVRKWRVVHRKAKKDNSNQSAEHSLLDDEGSLLETIVLNSDVSLLDILRELTPLGFEKICRELLRESGFQNVEITGGVADDGIDGFGTLELNPFVSFKVLFQCKRYGAKTTVSRSQVGDFRNAMIGRAEKGIIITTSAFSNSAIREANRDGASPIELVDGEKLVQMFKMAELGVIKETVYNVDVSFFEKYMR